MISSRPSIESTTLNDDLKSRVSLDRSVDRSIDRSLDRSNKSIDRSLELESDSNSNSIYHLTLASDLSRLKHNRQKNYVTLNGGLTTINNLSLPTINDIPPIHLSKLKKVKNESLVNSLVSPSVDDFKIFESSYSRLTKDVLEKLDRDYIGGKVVGSGDGVGSVDGDGDVGSVDSHSGVDSPNSVDSNVGGDFWPNMVTGGDSGKFTNSGAGASGSSGISVKGGGYDNLGVSGDSGVSDVSGAAESHSGDGVSSISKPGVENNSINKSEGFETIESAISTNLIPLDSKVENLTSGMRKDSTTSNRTTSIPNRFTSVRKTLVNKLDNEILQSIPKVFTTPNFRLDDPHIFNQVIENLSILDNNKSDFTETLGNNTSLNEKFSNYLDLVEISLIKEISKSSDSFFTTIGDISNIKEESDQVLKKYNQTLEKLNDLKKNQSIQGLNILSKMKTKKNVITLESSLLQLSYITKLFKLANMSFINEKFDKCMNEIVILESLIYGLDISDYNFPICLKTPLQNLSNLPALINIRNDIQNLKNNCAKGFINEFVSLLIEDLRNHYESVPVQDTFNRLFISSDPRKKYPLDSKYKSYQTIESNMKEKLADLIQNLVQSDHILEAYSTYKDRLVIEIKGIIQKNIPVATSGFSNDYSLADNSQVSSRSSPNPESASGFSGTQSLQTNIRSLTPREFELMLQQTYANLSECLRRLTSHQKLLLDFALTYIPADASFDVMSLDITNAINKSIELTQSRLTKVINVRSELIADLPVPFYLKLYSISSAYLQECEFINPGYVSTEAGSKLSDWFQHHIKYFVHRVHLKALKSMVNTVEKEIWREITDSKILNIHQVTVDEIILFSENIGSNISNFINDLWFRALDYYEGEGKEITEVNIPENSSKSNIVVKGELFLVPNLVLHSLPHLKDYLIIFKMFPNHSHTIENNILNYFKFMNSKISQSVLNAGATRTAGLKHITTKNIALCIQTIEYTILLLPYLQMICASKPAPRSQEFNQNRDELTFPQIISNFKDHENELFAKLVAIMFDRTVNHSAAAMKIDWSQSLPRQQQCHQYMEALVKETLTITKVLTKYLPEIKCSFILLQVFDNYKKSFVRCYCVDIPQPKDMTEKQMILKDIDYFRSQLCDLPGYGNSGQVIWENVNSMPTLEESTMDEKLRHQEMLMKSQEAEKKVVEKTPAVSDEKTTETLFVAPSTETDTSARSNEAHQNEASEKQSILEDKKLDDEINKEIEQEIDNTPNVDSNVDAVANSLNVESQLIDDSFMDSAILSGDEAGENSQATANSIFNNVLKQEGNVQLQEAESITPQKAKGVSNIEKDSLPEKESVNVVKSDSAEVDEINLAIDTGNSSSSDESTFAPATIKVKTEDTDAVEVESLVKPTESAVKVETTGSEKTKVTNAVETVEPKVKLAKDVGEKITEVETTEDTVTSDGDKVGSNKLSNERLDSSKTDDGLNKEKKQHNDNEGESIQLPKVEAVKEADSNSTEITKDFKTLQDDGKESEVKIESAVSNDKEVSVNKKAKKPTKKKKKGKK